MEFFIFILILSLISFSVAFLAYGFCLRFSVPRAPEPRWPRLLLRL